MDADVNIERDSLAVGQSGMCVVRKFGELDPLGA